MEREELRTLPLGHAWTPGDLRDHFAAVWGGVAFPGRRPGFALVAGLCSPRAKDDVEIHVLDEAESEDLGALLRACRGLGKRYRMAGMLRDDPFNWIGDGGHAGARQIMYRLNDETGNEYGPDQLTIQSTTLLDAPTPYLGLFSILSDCTREDRKTLYLHGSKAAHAMNEVPRNEVADARFGDYPAIEALAFVVDGLRSWPGQQALEAGRDNADPYRNWERFRRRRRA